ncbi:hypothetical protein DERP_011059 [Dermatophagoides pteronyssinus]|uniref:Uncharacterized protein n=1 Tax=Dermatophagoides pteronyssinus TaxID=6956 RepID=A0ABQ8J8P8_DERPT|nr:hypothetical protein DERP_011059 [Dermatophagoides pteronyssinus]
MIWIIETLGNQIRGKLVEMYVIIKCNNLIPFRIETGAILRIVSVKFQPNYVLCEHLAVIEHFEMNGTKSDLLSTHPKQNPDQLNNHEFELPLKTA